MLLLPYTVESSRSFQPDPLLVSLTVTATWLLVRYDDDPSPRRFLVAAAVSGAAVLVKGVAAPYLALVFLALVVARFGWRRALAQPALWGFGLLALVPAALYYVVGVFTGGQLGSQAQGSFIPSMFRTADFWHGWANQITTVTTWRLAVVAFVVSLVLARERRVRLVVGALWLAYFLVGLAVAYRTASHDYYHLPLVPVVALGTAVGVARVGFGRALVAAVFVVILGVAVSSEPTLLPRSQKTALLRQSSHVGSVVHHSTHVLYIAPAYGLPLEYHGRLAGMWWPTYDDLQLERLQQQRPLSAAARFRTLSRTVDGAQWFVALDLGEVRSQPDLQRLLSRYKVADEGATWKIYDLRTRA
jgi:4-amino-4-deoxy-L-arabinose transferase-like glycosyltransferase